MSTISKLYNSITLSLPESIPCESNLISSNRIWSYPLQHIPICSIQFDSMRFNATQFDPVRLSQSETTKSIQFIRVHFDPVSIQFQFNGKQNNWIEFKSMRSSPIQHIPIQYMQSNFSKFNSQQCKVNQFDPSQVKWYQDNSSRMGARRIQLQSSSNAIKLNSNPIQFNASHETRFHFDARRVSSTQDNPIQIKPSNPTQFILTEPITVQLNPCPTQFNTRRCHFNARELSWIQFKSILRNSVQFNAIQVQVIISTCNSRQFKSAHFYPSQFNSIRLNTSGSKPIEF